MPAELRTEAAQKLVQGAVIPAHPLALTPTRRLDERRQRALTRYYLHAGAGGLAVGVHTTQFEIREAGHGLLEPVLSLAAEEMKARAPEAIRIAGVCGRTEQALREAQTAKDLGYDVALVSLAAFPDDPDERLVDHCRAVGEVLPLMGFYLQPAVGGRPLSLAFWRRFCELEAAVAIKVAPFDRYRTLDVLRAVAESGAENRISLYTGNDDHIVLDLLSPAQFNVGGRAVTVSFVGGLLGQWAVWTRRAVELLEELHALRESGANPPGTLLVRAGQLTEANGAIFDVRNRFAGCIPGIHEVLRQSGLLAGRWCLDPSLELSPGQQGEIDRVCRAYPHLTDQEFIKENLDGWLR